MFKALRQDYFNSPGIGAMQDNVLTP